MALVGSTGIAIDMGRVQIAQSRMQNALDAAGLAVGSEVSSTNINTETSKYFYANFPTNYLGTTITGGPSAVLSATPDSPNYNNLITLNVSGTVPNIFMQIFGSNSTPISATSQVNRQSKGMELVLVMDNTGSMADAAGGGVSKIDAAKTAVQSLLNAVYGNGNTQPNLWVGVVPFSQAVNIGTNHPTWMDTGYDSTLNWGNTSWAGCVEARANGSATPQLDISDDPPTVRPFKEYYSKCNTNAYYPNKWYGANASSYNNCLTNGTVHYQTVNTTSQGPNLYCPQSVLPMVAEKDKVMVTVNNMQATGGTLINMGLAWGWRMLSPRWQSMWGGEMDANHLPLAYNTPLMNKVVVLMTDGDNTLYGNNNATSGTDMMGVYSAYGYTNGNALALTNGECTSGYDCTSGQTEINNRMLSVCSSMKANGIIIYTIALGAEVSSMGQSLLQACATSPSYYFLSPTTTSLQTIFQQIGDSLSSLRISQ